MATPDAPQIVAILDDAFSPTYPSFSGKVQNGGLTNDGTPKIEGTGMPGERISIYSDGTYLGITTVRSDGGWSFDVTKAMMMDEGLHNLTATATLLGMTSASSEVFSFTLDMTGPSVDADSLKVSAHSTTITEISHAQADASVTIYFNVEINTADGDAVYMVPSVVIGTKVFYGQSYAAINGIQIVAVTVRGSLLLASTSSDPFIKLTACLVDEAGNATSIPEIVVHYTITPPAALQSLSVLEQSDTSEVVNHESQDTVARGRSMEEPAEPVMDVGSVRNQSGAERFTALQIPTALVSEDVMGPTEGSVDIGNDIDSDNGAAHATLDITAGGQDTLMYQLLTAAQALGDKGHGNGADTVNGFTVSPLESDANADRIDLSSLLQGYSPSVDGQFAAEYVDGVATIAAGDAIANYLKVEVSGNDTLIEIDRSGSGQDYSTLLTLTGVQTDLATLLANHQITLV